MGIFGSLWLGEKRSEASNSADEAFIKALKDTFGNVTASLFSVSARGDQALKLAAVFNAIHQQAQDIAALSINHTVKDANGYNAIVPDKLNILLHDQPYPYITSYTWRYMMVAHCLSSPGNGYTVIKRDAQGRVEYLEPVYDPYGVVIKMSDPQIAGYRKPFYQIPGYKELLHADDVLHFKLFTLDGYVGVSPITYHSETIGTQLTAERMHRSFWEKGGFIKGLLTIAGKLTKERRKEIGDQWNEGIRGYHIPVLDAGTDYKPINISQRDAQYIETRAMGVEDVARIMNIPISKLKIRDQKFANQEQQDLEYVKSTLNPIIRNFEQEIKMKLMPGTNQAAKFDTRSILRGDIRTRGQYYKDMFYMGAYSPNDIRKLEGDAPRDGGDAYFTPVNTYSDEQLEVIIKKLQNENNNGA